MENSYQNIRNKRKRMLLLTIVTYYTASMHIRESKRFRKRWDSDYLINLAIEKDSFVKEYRLNPTAFNHLHELLYDNLCVDARMAEVALSGTNTRLYSTHSRLAAALIILGGGRCMEAMRTHGMPESVVYFNLHKICKIINSNPALAITCPNDLSSLKDRANGFKNIGSYELFQYATGAIDGLALPIRTPRREFFVYLTKLTFLINLTVNPWLVDATSANSPIPILNV